MRRQTKAWLGVILMILSLAVTTPAGVGAGAAGAGGVSPLAVDIIGDEARGRTFTDLDGRAVSLSEFRGKVVVLNFWASWCGYCVEEMPELESLHRRYGRDGLVVLGVNVEDAATARRFMRAHGYTFRTLVDANGLAAQSFGVEALPTTVVIGRDGRADSRLVGAHSGEDFLAAARDAGLDVGRRTARRGRPRQGS